MRTTTTFLAVSLLLAAGGALAQPQTASAPASQPATTQAAEQDLLLGEWSGNWASSDKNMGGTLKCKITRVPGKEGYKAVFDAVWGGVFTHQQTCTLKVRDKGEKNAKWSFGGEEDLGLLNGGLYKYDGATDGAEFVCKYDSTFDKGTFKMKRVANGK